MPTNKFYDMIPKFREKKDKNNASKKNTFFPNESIVTRNGKKNLHDKCHQGGKEGRPWINHKKLRDINLIIDWNSQALGGVCQMAPVNFTVTNTYIEYYQDRVTHR